jgi:ABC-type transporter Mla subunit MlaD
LSSNDDFDISALFQGPGAVLAGVLGVADNARKTIGGVMETIATLQRAAVAVEQLVSRMNRLVDDLEAPMRALTPELERSVARMQRLSGALEGPIDRLLPGLEAAVGTFDRVALSQLPETVEEARQQMQTLLDLFSEVPRRLGLLGALSPLGSLLPRSKEPVAPPPAPRKTASPVRKATAKKAPSKRLAKSEPAKKTKR